MDLTGATDTTEIDLSSRAERAVARQFMGRVQWEMVLIGTGQAIVWLSTYVLTIRRRSKRSGPSWSSEACPAPMRCPSGSGSTH